MLLLTGEYEGTVDDKGRVFIPNRLRSQIDCGENGSGFYLSVGANGIMCLYPEKSFKQIALAESPGTVAPDEAVVYERMNFALASRVELDRQGRLLISERIRKRANLGGDLTLLGVRDHIELWNSEDWERYVTDHSSQFQQQTMQARQAVLAKQGKDL
jgi:MraZ protein